MIIVLAVMLSAIIFIFFRTRAFDAKKVLFLFISPTPTATPTSTPTPTLTSTPTPTPSPTPTATPTPSPTPTPTSLPTTSFETYFDEYSAQYKINKDELKKIAFCESGMNPGSVNGDYGGMYQFTTQTWHVTRSEMGKDTNPALRFDAKEAIETAAFKIANKGGYAWKNCL